MPQTCCKLWIWPACCKLSTSCSKSVEFVKLQQFCENQTFCNLIFVDLLQVVETTFVKLVDKKSWQSTCIKPVDNLQQTCYHQAGASDANASWYRLDDCKATSLQQTCSNLRDSSCVDLRTNYLSHTSSNSSTKNSRKWGRRLSHYINTRRFTLANTKCSYF